MTPNSELIREAIAGIVQGKHSPAKLLGIEPRVVNGLYAMGLQSYRNGRIAEAGAIFERCLVLDPFRADFWIALAAARQAMERFDEAGELYQIAGLLSDDATPVAYAAACFARAGQTDRAQVLAEFVREQPEIASRTDPWLAIAETPSREESQP